MFLNLTGEDGCTLFVFMNKDFLELVKEDLNLISIDKVWLRPSFGRGAGPKIIEEERGYSGFGEPDALILGTDSQQKRKVVFLESKKSNVHKGKRCRRELTYQFYLKMALVYSMLNPVKMKLGLYETENSYYCIELNDPLSPFAETLYKYYKEYSNKKNPIRKNGWMIKQHSLNSPALIDIEQLINKERDNLVFEFYALGFNNNTEDVVVLSDLFEDAASLPVDIKETFAIRDGVYITFRNISVQPNELRLRLPV